MRELEKASIRTFKTLLDSFYHLLGKKEGAPKEIVEAYWPILKNYPQQIILDGLEAVAETGKHMFCPPAEIIRRACAYQTVLYRQEYYNQNPSENPDTTSTTTNPEISAYFVKAVGDWLNGKYTAKEYMDHCLAGCEKFKIKPELWRWKWFMDRPDYRPVPFGRSDNNPNPRRKRFRENREPRKALTSGNHQELEK